MNAGAFFSALDGALTANQFMERLSMKKTIMHITKVWAREDLTVVAKVVNGGGRGEKVPILLTRRSGLFRSIFLSLFCVVYCTVFLISPAMSSRMLCRPLRCSKILLSQNSVHTNKMKLHPSILKAVLLLVCHISPSPSGSFSLSSKPTSH